MRNSLSIAQLIVGATIISLEKETVGIESRVRGRKELINGIARKLDEAYEAGLVAALDALFPERDDAPTPLRAEASAILFNEN